MRLYTIQQKPFERKLEACSGSVFLETEGNRLLDIKHDMAARDIFLTMEIPQSGVNLFCTDKNDMYILLQHMVESNLYN